jgi:hypothetical protein
MPQAAVEDTSKSRVYRQLRHAIIMGRCRPGERLNLGELKKAYDANLSPSRDALRMLAQEGPITIKPRFGCFISRTTPGERWACLSSSAFWNWQPSTGRRPASRKNRLISWNTFTPAMPAMTLKPTIGSPMKIGDSMSASPKPQAIKNRQKRSDTCTTGWRASWLCGARAKPNRRFTRLIEAGAGMMEAAHEAMLPESTSTHQAVLGRVMPEDGASWHLGAYARSKEVIRSAYPWMEAQPSPISTLSTQ